MRLSSEKKTILLLLVLMVTLGQLGVDLYLPSMPYIAKGLQSSISSIKLTVPLYLLGFGVSQLFYGPIADSIGRKPTLHFGLLIFLIGSIGCFLSESSLILILFRTLQGLGIGAAIINVRAIMRDAFHGKQMAKVSAWIAMVWAVTPVVAPVIGGYIQTYLSWRANFAVMFVYAGMVGTLTFLFLPETSDKTHRKPLHLISILKLYKKIFTHRVFLSFSLMSSFCYGYFISFATASPFLFQTQLGLSPIEYGWTLLAIAFGTALGSITCSKLVSQLKITRVTFIGSLLMLVATAIMFILACMGQFTVLTILIPPFFGSLGVGIILPNCTTGAMTPYKANAGIAGAAFGFVQMFNSFVFSTIISHLPTKNAFPLSLELLVISLLIFLLFIFFIRPHFQEEEVSHNQ